MPRRFISKAEIKGGYKKRGQVFMRKKLIIPTLTLVMMMFSLGIGPATPQEILAMTNEPYTEMTVDMPNVSVSKRETHLVKASNQSSAWVDCGNNIWKVSNNQGGYITNSWFQDIDGSWYLLNENGEMRSGLIYDSLTNNNYVLETDHNGYFGKMVSTSGNYKGVYLDIFQGHDGTFGHITNVEAVESLKNAGVQQTTVYGMPTASTKAEAPAPDTKSENDSGKSVTDKQADEWSQDVDWDSGTRNEDAGGTWNWH